MFWGRTYKRHYEHCCWILFITLHLLVGLTHPYKFCNMAFPASWKPSHYDDNLLKNTQFSTQYYTINNVMLFIKHYGINKYPFRPRRSARWFEKIVNILDLWLFLNSWRWLRWRWKGWCRGRSSVIWETSSVRCVIAFAITFFSLNGIVFSHCTFKLNAD